MPGLLSPRGTALEKALLEVLGDHEPSGAPFCTDGGRLAAVGIHSLVCGPGELSQAHQPDESIPREAFERGPDVILAVLAGLLGSPPPPGVGGPHPPGPAGRYVPEADTSGWRPCW